MKTFKFSKNIPKKILKFILPIENGNNKFQRKLHVSTIIIFEV